MPLWSEASERAAPLGSAKPGDETEGSGTGTVKAKQLVQTPRGEGTTLLSSMD
jgi:hypothetical protein